MKRSLLILLFVAFTAHLFGQRRVQRDTLMVNGVPMGYSVTNWYCIEGDKCPTFTVYNENGQKVTEKDLQGKTAVISFWISSCTPCRKELGRAGAEIVDLFPPDKFIFLTIGSGETAESARRFRELSKATFPLCYDESGEVFNKFADNGFPKIL